MADGERERKEEFVRSRRRRRATRKENERKKETGQGKRSLTRSCSSRESQSDLIGCGSDSLNSSTTFQRARARSRASTRQGTDVSRGKGAFARLLSSLPHYSIMMACGVCRTPFALIASAFSPPRCSLARFEHRLLSCSLSPSLPPLSSLLSPLPSSLFPSIVFVPLSPFPVPRSTITDAFHQTHLCRTSGRSMREFRSSRRANVFVGPSISAEHAYTSP